MTTSSRRSSSADTGLAGLAGLGTHDAPELVAPGRDVVLRGVRMFDGESRVISDATIVIRDTAIAHAGPSSSAPPAAPHALVVDLPHLTATPGLIDMHSHSVDEHDLSNYLRHGVTSLRVVGPHGEEIDRLRAASRGVACLPRVLACGPMIEQPPAAWPEWTHPVDSPEHAARVAAGLARSGTVDGFVVTQHVTEDLARAVVTIGREYGLPVGGQVWWMDGAQAVGAGLGQLDNTSRTFVSSTWPVRRLMDYASPGERMAIWAQAWGSVDWDATMRILDAMVGSDAAYCPTLIAHFRWGGLERPDLGPAPTPDRPPKESERILRRVERAWSPSMQVAMRAALSNREEWLRRFHGAGGRILAGTATYGAGPVLQSELRYLHEAGLPAMAVLRTATGDAGHALGRPELGRLHTGCAADIVLVEGDPTRDLSAFDRIRGVIVRGRIAVGLVDADAEEQVLTP